MSKVRIIVECCFKEVLQLFTAFDFPRTEKVLLSPIGLQYPVVVLLHNAHVCLYRLQIPQFFSNLQEDINLLEPPTLEEYFH